MKPYRCSTEIAFFSDCHEIAEVTKFQSDVNDAPALSCLLGLCAGRKMLQMLQWLDVEALQSVTK